MKRLSVMFALMATAAFAGEWTGYISDSKCGKAHADGSAKSISCVSGCIKGGSKPVFVADGKVISIANPEKIAAELYGQKVTVQGDLKGDSLTVASAAAAK